jgi:hypothetical protein
MAYTLKGDGDDEICMLQLLKHAAYTEAHCSEIWWEISLIYGAVSIAVVV